MEIVERHRRAASADSRDLDDLLAAADATPPPRDFRAALKVQHVSVIAEVKRRSPSRGDLAPDLDPAVLATTYARGGAAALSVLTDAASFGGSPADLRAARAAAPDLPVLRKDFTVDPRDIADARIMGADAVLLIVAALTDGELAQFQELATRLQLTALVEVHDSEELDRAIAAGAQTIGVNQRDLRTFEIDNSRARQLRPHIPAGVVTVAESGIRRRTDVPDAYDAVLVGESLVTSHDPAAAIKRLKGERP